MKVAVRPAALRLPWVTLTGSPAVRKFWYMASDRNGMTGANSLHRVVRTVNSVWWAAHLSRRPASSSPAGRGFPPSQRFCSHRRSLRWSRFASWEFWPVPVFPYSFHRFRDDM